MWKSLKRVQQYIDEPNEYRVLRLVRNSDAISRTEIAQLCQLSKPTVSEIVNRFLKDGFFERVGAAASTYRGGRRRELLRFNPKAGCVIGVDIRMTECLVAVTDLNATIRFRKEFSYPAGSTPKHVLNRIYQTIDASLTSDRECLQKCVGLGVGLPGLIDRSRGVVRVADTLGGWEGMNLREAFQHRYGVPVFVENDVKARTLAEFYFGVGKGKENIVFLWVGDGVGAGIIVDGKLHRGITESAGEVGYNELRCGEAGRELFPLLFSGQRDFGDMLANAAIIRRFAAHLPSVSDVTIESIFGDAAAGNDFADQLLDEVAALVGALCIDMINTLNPEQIVIGGKIAEAGTLVLDRVQQKVREDILAAPAEAVQIVPARLRDDGVILGAVGIVLNDLFRPVRNGQSLKAPRREAVPSVP